LKVRKTGFPEEILYIMAEDILKGEKEEITGKLRNAKGKITGRPSERISGKLEEEKGKFKKENRDWRR
jgi:uncharacterized protein YjbJ (UPF0337 family)